MIVNFEPRELFFRHLLVYTRVDISKIDGYTMEYMLSCERLLKPTNWREIYIYDSYLMIPIQMKQTVVVF